MKIISSNIGDIKLCKFQGGPDPPDPPDPPSRSAHELCYMGFTTLDLAVIRNMKVYFVKFYKPFTHFAVLT